MGAEEEIRQVLQTYQERLNASDVKAAACYTSDGVFIPAGLPTVAGTAIAVAYALTHSHGTQTELATGTDSVESNRELFIFRREGGSWKIARYMFNLNPEPVRA